jgi:spore coat polysaccharide biosynthesis protein SpsF (cytidylyltransferase family)
MFRTKEFMVSKDVKRPQYRLSVDTPKDLELMKAIFRDLYKKGGIKFPDVIAMLDKRPELLKINEDIEQRKCEVEMVSRSGVKKVRITAED